jgi:hypothetical protein
MPEITRPRTTVVFGREVAPGHLIPADGHHGLLPVRKVVTQVPGSCPDGATAPPGQCACNRGGLPQVHMPRRIVEVDAPGRTVAEVTVYDHVRYSFGRVHW